MLYYTSILLRHGFQIYKRKDPIKVAIKVAIWMANQYATGREFVFNDTKLKEKFVKRKNPIKVAISRLFIKWHQVKGKIYKKGRIR